MCGSIFLDLGFEVLIRRRLGAHAIHVLTPKNITGALERFDVIKREFNPLETNDEEYGGIYLRGAPEIPQIGLEEACNIIVL